MPNLVPYITAGELAILSASMTLFLIFPGFLSWGDERRERKRRASAPAPAPSLEPLPTVTTHGDASAPAVSSPSDSSSVAPAAAVVMAEVAIVDRQVEPAAIGSVLDSPGPEPEVGGTSMTTLPIESAQRPVPLAAEVPEPLPAPAAAPAWSLVSPERPESAPASGRQFRLDELRDADAIAPSLDAADPLVRRGREWLEAHANVLSELVLEADPLPVSRCFAGAVERNGSLHIRLLLFSRLWPATADDADAVGWIVAEDPPAAWVQSIA